MKKILSPILSASLWMILPFTLYYWMSGLTAAGRRQFWKDFPVWCGTWLLFFLIIAGILHVCFGKYVARLRGWRFWLFPLVSLPSASIVFWMLCLLWDLVIKQENPFQGSTAISFLGFILVLLCFSLVWMTYPLAIVNQALVKYLWRSEAREAGCS